MSSHNNNKDKNFPNDLGILPYFHKNHAKPMTRRDLVAQGFMSTYGFAMLPSFMSMLFARQAYGQCAGGDGSVITVGAAMSLPAILVIDSAGGNGGARVSAPRVEGGALMSAAGAVTLGIPTGSMPASLDGPQFMGQPTWTGNPFEAGVRTGIGTATTALDNTRMVTAAGTSPDDSANIAGFGRFNMMAAKLMAQESSQYLAVLTGDQTSTSRGRFSVPNNEDFTSVAPSAPIQDAGDAAGLVQAGRLSTQLGNAGVSALLKAVNGLSAAQLKKLNALSVPEQIQVLTSCANVRTEGTLTSIDPTIANPALNANITATLGAGQESGTVGTLLHLLAKGLTPIANIVVNGGDYHGQGAQAAVTHDTRVGTIVGQALRVFEAEGRKLLIILRTDGAVAFNANGAATINGTQQLGAAADNGARSAQTFIYRSPSGVPEVQTPVLGAFNAAGAVANVEAFSQNPDALAGLAMWTLLNVLGRGTESALVSAWGSNPFGTRLNRLVAFSA